ncbi:plasma-membrane proton-efflux P-type ATPase [Umbelopsis sp. AD052]|nr:plasma-membrane proton-efflux P-type ATPase [Umbelopsis sp. AD052]
MNSFFITPRDEEYTPLTLTTSNTSPSRTNSHTQSPDDIPPDLERLLQTDPRQGLDYPAVLERQKQFGRNEIIEKKRNRFLHFLSFFMGTIAYLIEISIVLTAVTRDWVNFGILLGLLIINAIIGFSEEAKAESALDALKSTLALHTRCIRGGQLIEVDARDLVPGDVIVMRLGDIVPADARLLGIDATGEPTSLNLQVDQSSLTGESLPADKGAGESVYSSSIIKQGQQLAVVTKTGANTFIGRAASLISITTESGHFQQIIGQIGNFLIFLTIILVLIIFIVDVVDTKIRTGTVTGQDILDTLEEIIVLTVAAIPVGLPTVMSVTMAVGAKQLASRQVIVKRLTAVEEFASVSILCSDKTGTLTLNELTFDEPYLSPGETTDSLLLDAYLASEPGTNDPIEKAVREAAESTVPALRANPGSHHGVPGYKITNFIPFNPSSKMTQATVTNLDLHTSYQVCKGAPQVIIGLVDGDNAAYEDAIARFATRGLRALGVARTLPGTSEWKMVGLISLLDPPRPDSADTIAECLRHGVSVKMITGDQTIIAKEVAGRLGLGRVILDANHLVDNTKSDEELIENCIRADGFAEVIPEHKYRVVELLQSRGLLVAMTGDGVNDAPALKKANVGIAVQGCTDAARSAADIVLLAPGLSTIIDGIKTSRAIFQRLRSYALYRITSTIHFLIFFFIITIAEDWQMPAILLILICVLNDAATLVIAVDNAVISPHPDKWRLGQLIFLSCVLASILSLFSFAHFYIARDIMHVTSQQLSTIMYLHISSAPHFVIFSTRIADYWWRNRPSIVFTAVILGTQVIALIFSIFGVFGESVNVGAISWAWGLAILGISLVTFMLLDFVKVWILRSWSFELTAKLWPTPGRRARVRQRELTRQRHENAQHNWGRVAKAARVVQIAKAFQNL